MLYSCVSFLCVLSDFMALMSLLPSVHWHCWLDGRMGIRPVKNWAVGCWRGFLSGVRCRLAYGPAGSTATHCLAPVKSRLVSPFWCRLTWVVPDWGLLNGCVCVFYVTYLVLHHWNLALLCATTLFDLLTYRLLMLFLLIKLVVLCSIVLMVYIAFSALTLLVWCQEEHLASKNWLMMCWCGYVSVARCRLFAYGPADTTASRNPIISCLI